jgi:hypothetical protein
VAKIISKLNTLRKLPTTNSFNLCCVGSFLIITFFDIKIKKRRDKEKKYAIVKWLPADSDDSSGMIAVSP